MAIPTDTDLKTMDYSFEGRPFAFVPAKSDIDLMTMDFTFEGRPFATNPTAGAGHTDFVIGLGEAFVLTDNLSRTTQTARSTADSLGLTDEVAFALTLNLGDAITLSDVFATAMDYSTTLADTIALVDGIATQRGIIANLADTVGLADNQTKTSAAKLTLADSLHLADSVVELEAFRISIQDHIHLADARSRAVEYYTDKADAIALADSSHRASELRFSEAINLGDNRFPPRSGKQVDEYVFLNDSIVVDHVYNGPRIYGQYPPITGHYIPDADQAGVLGSRTLDETGHFNYSEIIKP